MQYNHTTAYRQELRYRILDTAMMLFKAKGIRNVRMDDIATALSISKRTLYEIYDNKEQLLLESVRKHHNDEEAAAMRFQAEHNDVMAIILEFYKHNLEELGKMNPAFFLEIRKYKKVEAYLQERKQQSQSRAIAFFERGVQGGYFLPQLNYDIVTRLGEAAMDFVMKTRMYEEFPLREIYENFVSVLLRGYCTEKGQRILDDFLKTL